MQMLFLSRLNMHLSLKIRRVCVSEGAMPPSCAEQLSPRTFCQLAPLVPACSHGRIAENMSGGSCVPRCSDFRTAPPSCVPCFPGPSPQRAAVQGLDFRAYLLSSPLCPGIAASRGPASGVVSHGAAARPRSVSQSSCGMSV